jgi:hypothetical protein
MRQIANAAVHWAARCFALLVTASFLLILAGEFISPHSVPPAHWREWTGIVLLIAAIIGMLAAWKWELPGALVSLLALLAFVPVVGLHRFDVVAFAAIPSILFLVDWDLHR